METIYSLHITYHHTPISAMTLRNVNIARSSALCCSSIVVWLLRFKLLPRLLGRALGTSSDPIAERNPNHIRMRQNERAMQQRTIDRIRISDRTHGKLLIYNKLIEYYSSRVERKYLNDHTSIVSAYCNGSSSQH